MSLHAGRAAQRGPTQNECTQQRQMQSTQARQARLSRILETTAHTLAGGFLQGGRAAEGRSASETLEKGFIAENEVLAERFLLSEHGRALDFDVFRRMRGEADSFAMRLRYHDGILHRDLRPPQGGDFFDVLARSRWEILGMRVFAGVRENIGFLRFPSLEIADGLQGKVGGSLQERIVQELFALSVRSLRVPFERFPYISSRIRAHVQRLSDVLCDQRSFSLSAQFLLRDLGLSCAPRCSDANEQRKSAAEAKRSDAEGKGVRRSALQAAWTQTEQGGVYTCAAGRRATTKRADPRVGARAAYVSSMGTGIRRTRAFSYRAFTTIFDRIARPEDLCDANTLALLRRDLDKQLTSIGGGVLRAAHRLRRCLLSRQVRGWDFAQEEGVLDASCLSQVIVDPCYILPFKRERESRFCGSVVSLLIDNSGSMRGRSMLLAAMCADILARILELCSVRVEILGFTTGAWRGGRARGAWLACGKPRHPGRLNELLHIVYKSADTPWRCSRGKLGLMLREGLLKENIDGEALLWAERRLSSRLELRRILVVISDGAPVDEATFSANTQTYLEHHLRTVIAQIEQRKLVELCAIGIGHDVGRYYKRAIVLRRPEQLGDALIDHLTLLLSSCGN